MCGLLAEQRRPDLVLEVAARRPDLRFVITGGGRLEGTVSEAAAALPNVDFLGWVTDVDAVLAASRVVLYGQDPGVPYSDIACPNTLYQSIRLRRPLVYYCAGEPEAVSRRFRIGVRCEPTAPALEDAIDTALLSDGWQYDEAWRTISTGAGAAFQSVLRDAADGRARGRAYGLAMNVQMSPRRTRAANASGE
jgi:glycosyltransferase involved in cell wall biosynthesis